jgi:hypothetical protein
MALNLPGTGDNGNNRSRHVYLKPRLFEAASRLFEARVTFI